MANKFKLISSEEIIGQVAKRLADRIIAIAAKRSQGHCMQVVNADSDLMEKLCLEIRANKRFDNVYLVGGLRDPKKPYLITDTRVTELRNSPEIDVLIILRPSDIKASLRADDSIGEHTFEIIDPHPFLEDYLDEIIERLDEDSREMVKLILKRSDDAFAYRGFTAVEQKIQFVSNIIQNNLAKDEIGALYFLIGLIPDLDPRMNNKFERRLAKNIESVIVLLDGTKAAYSRIGALHLKRGRIEEALRRLLIEEDTLDRFEFSNKVFDRSFGKPSEEQLFFNHWEFADDPKEGVEAEVEILEIQGPRWEEPDHQIRSDEKMIVKWDFRGNESTICDFYIQGIMDDEEAFSISVKSKKKRKHTINLRKYDIEKSGQCYIRLTARDEGKMPICDESIATSDPFWIEVVESTEYDELGERRGSKEVPISNIYEAYFHEASKGLGQKELAEIKGNTLPHFYLDSSKKGKYAPKDRLTYKVGKTGYSLELNNWLLDIERSSLNNPGRLAKYLLASRDRSLDSMKDLTRVNLPFVAYSSPQLNEFIKARETFFSAVQSSLPNCDGLIESTDLIAVQSIAENYVQKYLSLIEALKGTIQSSSAGETVNVIALNRGILDLDTVEVRFDDLQEDVMILMMPTHPFRILWLLRYQSQLEQWLKELETAKALGSNPNDLFDKDMFNRLPALNYPSFILPESDQSVNLYLNIDSFGQFWLFYSPVGHSNLRRLLTKIQVLLSIETGEEILTGVSKKDIIERMKRFLRQHAYVKTLKLNVINPGKGQLVLDSLEDVIDESETITIEDRNIAFEVDLFGDDRRLDLLGYEFDKLMGTENPLMTRSAWRDSSRLVFSKHEQRELYDADSHLDAHLTLLIDHFKTKATTIKPDKISRSSFANGLITEFVNRFDTLAGTAAWTRYISPSICENDPLPLPEVSVQMHRTYQNLVACFLTRANRVDDIPAVQLEITDDDRSLIRRLHNLSDWVITIDRNFGIEYLDSPYETSLCEYYLIDYSPDFMENIGHRLITSTKLTSEVGQIIKPRLNDWNITNEWTNVDRILSALQSLSGKLILKLLTSRNKADEVLSMALLRMYFERNGKLKDSLLITLDDHPEFYAESRIESGSIRRSDVLKVSYDPSASEFVFNIIELKKRTQDSLGLLELRKEIKSQIDSSVEHIKSYFVPTQPDRIDRQIRNKELINLLQFYLQRSKRHNLINEQFDRDITQGLEELRKGNVNIRFEKSAFLIQPDLQQAEEIEKDFDLTIISLTSQTVNALFNEAISNPNDDDNTIETTSQTAKNLDVTINEHISKESQIEYVVPKEPERSESVHENLGAYEVDRIVVVADQPEKTIDEVNTELSPQSLKKKVDKIVQVLDAYGARIKPIGNALVGPSVIRFRFQPDAGTSVSKIRSRAEDLQLHLKSLSRPYIFIDKDAVAIDIPREKIATVYLSELLADPQYVNHPSNVRIPLGRAVEGSAVIIDLADSNSPHLLIGGQTGSGKSELMKSIIVSLLTINTPKTLRLILIDPKRVEFNRFSGLPFVEGEIIRDGWKAAEKLNKLVIEMDRRYDFFVKAGVNDIAKFNAALIGSEKLPRIVMVFDEFADFMLDKELKKTLETLISKLGAKARAAGIHLIVATQRPSADVVTGLIKANLTAKIALKVTNSINSQIIIDQNGAEDLFGKGDMLFSAEGKITRIQGAFISDQAVDDSIRDIISRYNPDSLKK